MVDQSSNNCIICKLSIYIQIQEKDKYNGYFDISAFVLSTKDSLKINDILKQHKSIRLKKRWNYIDIQKSGF